MPWQFGAVGLTENGGNRVIKYADALIDGVCLLKKPSVSYLVFTYPRRPLQMMVRSMVSALYGSPQLYNARRCLLQKPNHCLERLYVCFNSRYAGLIHKRPYFFFVGMQLKYRTRNLSERLVAWLSTLYKHACVIPIGGRNTHTDALKVFHSPPQLRRVRY